MYRSGSPYTVRSIPGQGRLMTRNPPDPSGTGLPSMVTISGTTPGNGRVADPGLVAIAPGSGAIIMCPVSVCHHVAVIGQRLPPIVSLYHIQASGLMGSPTVPSNRRLLMSCFFGHSLPHLTKVRMAVGAV